jgi:hypothetical protein
MGDGAVMGLPGWPARQLGQVMVAVFAVVLVAAAVLFGVWATATGSSAVFGRLTGLAGVFSLVLAVAVVAVGMLAWARRPAAGQMPGPGAAVVAEWRLEEMPWSTGREFCLWRGQAEITEAIQWLREHKTDSIRDAHEIKIHFAAWLVGIYFGSDYIMVDGQLIVKERNIRGKIYPLRALSSKLGSDVTIQVFSGTGSEVGANIYAVKLLVLKVGDQVVKCQREGKKQ